jgi:hypothetical protein
MRRFLPPSGFGWDNDWLLADYIDWSGRPFGCSFICALTNRVKHLKKSIQNYYCHWIFHI